MDIADGLQFAGQCLSRFKAGQKNQIMYFAHLAVLFINGTDFSRNDKTWVGLVWRRAVLDTVFRSQNVKPVLGGAQFLM